MTRGPNPGDAEIICVTTGTKCISGEHMSITGQALNDMHAEIMARRCLIKYFYRNLSLLATTDKHKSIFECKRGRNGYRLKPGIGFHLFINTAPCGDACIFSPHQTEEEDRHPNRTSRGQLRTKIEVGEGTVLVQPDTCFQTWDGILQVCSLRLPLKSKLITLRVPDF